ncbi:pentapeptide repeat-containing protein [Microbacterium paludicola]|uniref:pentapeptide repeat-containing protein n=1 Tax=Microbacterium paludicola TaxID=300019 RepID=UPI000A421589|nr:pentapeptide repeat-containing protein [Microbacterium paludicola]
MRRNLTLAGVLVVALAAGWLAIWLLPSALVDYDGVSAKARASSIATARQTVLWMLGGLIAISGLIFTWRRDGVASERARLDRDANLTSRFTDAIGQLGNDSIAVRVGGVYALERIAFDSPRDRQTILDVLAAYVRNNGERKPDAPSPVDVVAAGPVIGRITRMAIPEHSTDLHGAHFNKAELSNANLRGADLSYADIRYANFFEASLVGADLSDVSGWRVRLERADLRDAVMRQAGLYEAVLDDADLTNADLTGAKLEGASFRGAVLVGATFPRSQLALIELSSRQEADVLLVDDPPEVRGGPK